MRTFKTGDKDWTLRIDAPTIMAVRTEHSVDLASVECFDALTQDPAKCQLVLWSLCRKQAEGSGISASAFFEFLGNGDVSEQAASCCH